MAYCATDLQGSVRIVYLQAIVEKGLTATGMQQYVSDGGPSLLPAQKYVPT